ncbi:hypothetical protein CO615_09090 [Lysobacteraceae bacterium NML75-0749]|nr:hypothetical protein CO615_09090 [Xanthomonadaceae bacterium NML75-0749]PJK05565.1 hypothetical protein CO609_00960 [Xanthomonadaceae bacterium NML91-0268]
MIIKILLHVFSLRAYGLLIFPFLRKYPANQTLHITGTGFIISFAVFVLTTVASQTSPFMAHERKIMIAAMIPLSP